MIVSGSEHYIVPKRVFLVATLAVVGVFLGVVGSNHLYARRYEAFLQAKTQTVKTENKQLEKEKEEYRELFTKLSEGFEEETMSRESIVSFYELATRVLEGLQAMQDLLEEKEFQLWEKEGLLEYQEERLMNTEDVEHEMASFINMMAADLIARNQTLPPGLVDEPYFRPPSRAPPITVIDVKEELS